MRYTNLSGSSIDHQAHFQYELPNNTSGGDIVLGDWRTWSINSTVYNNIVGCTLAANQVTLPIGTYTMEARILPYNTRLGATRLRDVSNNITLGYGVTGDALRSDQHLVGGIAVVGATDAVVEVQIKTSATQLVTGMGQPANLGETELYLELWINRII